MLETIMSALKLNGATSLAFKELFDAVVVMLPDSEEHEVRSAYLDLLASERRPDDEKLIGELE